jgi:C4-dicarboxylate-specific signal transduction histidine kinase
VLDDIRSDDLRASEIIQHIRALAKNRETEVEQFDANDLIRAVLRLIAPTLKQRGVSITADLKRLPLVRADRIHVQQVLLNLLFNGMDAMAALPEYQRSIRISTSHLDGAIVEVCVRDRGPGVPPDQLEKIFDSFFTTKKNGLGLGLSITRSLLEAHGGAIRAENNREGGGAMLRFTLPAVERRGDSRSRAQGRPA